ncbi:MAG: hypothetical protein RIQ60_3471 [Pseudomonadota bacterium]
MKYSVLNSSSLLKARHALAELMLAATALAALGASGAALAGPHEGRAEARELQREGVMLGEGRGRWWDGAHGHGRAYPVPGWRVHNLPSHSRVVFYGGVRYNFFDGVWYSPGPSGFVVVRPPFGVVVSDLPTFATVLTIGAVSYWYANGVYYRPLRDGGGYEVVPAPVAAVTAGSANNSAPAGDKLYIYPRQNQSPETQASDEYECHRWAVTQSGFDPTTNATSTGVSDPSKRGDYGRAQAACLEGRGYTVK